MRLAIHTSFHSSKKARLETKPILDSIAFAAHVVLQSCLLLTDRTPLLTHVVVVLTICCIISVQYLQLIQCYKDSSHVPK